ncbi:phosphoribosyltransferase [Candidatus Mycoplasma pogonae]
MEKFFNKVIWNKEQIELAIQKIANNLNNHYKDEIEEVLVIAVLDGSVVFAGHLLPYLDFKLIFKTTKLSLYGKEIRISEDNTIEAKFDFEIGIFANKKVLILEDLVDTGKTLKIFKTFLLSSGAKDIKIATLFRKSISVRKVDIEPDWWGLDIPDEWVAGFGIDSRGKYRNCNFLGIVKPEYY